LAQALASGGPKWAARGGAGRQPRHRGLAMASKSAAAMAEGKARDTPPLGQLSDVMPMPSLPGSIEEDADANDAKDSLGRHSITITPAKNEEVIMTKAFTAGSVNSAESSQSKHSKIQRAPSVTSGILSNMPRGIFGSFGVSVVPVSGTASTSTEGWGAGKGPQSIKEYQLAKKRNTRTTMARLSVSSEIGDTYPSPRSTAEARARMSSLRGPSQIITEIPPPRPSGWARAKDSFFAKSRLPGACRALNKHRYFQSIMFSALLVALFFPDFWILADASSFVALDVLLTIVFVLFMFELIVQSVGLMRAYVFTFFFWMDILGALSLLLDMSYLEILPESSDWSNNTFVLRAARIAKLSTRAGRVLRAAKLLLRFLPGMRDQISSAEQKGSAKQISSRLVNALSVRVSCLIIIMVLVMPLFSMWTYPGSDGSLESWLDVLDKTSSRSPGDFARQVSRFEAFYADYNYFPYSLRAVGDEATLPTNVSVVLPWASSRGPPTRSRNIISKQHGGLLCDFNFTGPSQTDSLMNVFLLVVIMVFMIGASNMLSTAVGQICLQPLEGLLAQMKDMATMIFKEVTDLTMREDTDNSEEDGQAMYDEDHGDAFGSETLLLQKVVAKLAAVGEMSKKKEADPFLEGLGEQENAVLHAFQGGDSTELREWDDQDSHAASESSDDDLDDDDHEEGSYAHAKSMIDRMGLSLDMINSWNVCTLELDRTRNHAAAMFLMNPHNHGAHIDSDTMAQFLEACEANYNKTLPYHTWFHAVDVMHCVHRLMNILKASNFLSSNERFALLVSSAAHDLCHPGLNNTYLVEASNEIALMYNDKSPLENMHCAKLFEITNPHGSGMGGIAKHGDLASPRNDTKDTAIFQDLSKTDFHEVRSICIDAILHTDNALHFPMIKEVQMLYEVNSEIFQDAEEAGRLDKSVEWPTKDVTEVFRKTETRKLLTKLILHYADISNSLKPFRICRTWAFQAMEEFCRQGDMERRYGIPVQPLNDRQKVNKSFSQICFIEFLVTPMVMSTLAIFPPTEALGEQMIQNVKAWHRQWLNDTSPKPSEEQERALTMRVVKLESRFNNRRHSGLF